MESGIGLIANERKEQIEKHGKTIDFDATNNNENQLINAASFLMQINSPILYKVPKNWNAKVFQKMIKKSRKERLIIAGALIAAELDRIIQNE